MIMYYLKLYLLTLGGGLAIDLIWLAYMVPRFYQKHLGELLSTPPNLWAAIAFYLIFVAGLLVFVIIPAVDAGSVGRALILGAFFGLVTYATYDLTNQATLKDWPWIVTLVDLAWGTVLAASVSAVGFLAGRWLQ